MKENESILDQLKKAELRAVPNQFFNDFSEELWQLIQLEDDTEGLLHNLSLNRFENDYKNTKTYDIDSFKDKVAPKVVSLSKPSKTKQFLLWTGAVAASLLVFFTWPESSDSGLELASDEVRQEVILAYLDESDLVDYLVEAEADETEETVLEEEVFYEALEDEIYNYINDI